MWYKFKMSGEEDIIVTEETFVKIMDDERILVRFRQYDGTWKVLNKNFIITAGADFDTTEQNKIDELKIKNEKERIEHAKKVQEAAQEEQEQDIIEKFIH
jgi:hypothetical protein